MGLWANTGPSKHRNEYTLGTDYMLETQLSQPENTKKLPLKKKKIFENQKISKQGVQNGLTGFWRGLKGLIGGQEGLWIV